MEHFTELPRRIITLQQQRTRKRKRKRRKVYYDYAMSHLQKVWIFIQPTVGTRMLRIRQPLLVQASGTTGQTQHYNLDHPTTDQPVALMPGDQLPVYNQHAQRISGSYMQATTAREHLHQALHPTSVHLVLYYMTSVL